MQHSASRGAQNARLRARRAVAFTARRIAPGAKCKRRLRNLQRQDVREVRTRPLFPFGPSDPRIRCARRYCLSLFMYCQIRWPNVSCRPCEPHRPCLHGRPRRPSRPGRPRRQRPMMAAPHVPQQPTSAVMTCWRDWFATGNQRVSVRNRIVLLQRAQIRSEPAFDHGHYVQRFFLNEHDLELQSAQRRIQELESMIKRQDSSTSFMSNLSRERPPGLPAVQSRPMSALVRVTRCFWRPSAIASLGLKTIHWYRAQPA